MCHLSKVAYEPSVDVTESKEGAKLSLVFRRSIISERLRVRTVNLEIAGLYHVPKIFDLFLEEMTFLDFQRDAGVSQTSEDLIDMGDMFLDCLGVYDDVVDVNQACLPLVFCEY